MTKSITTLNDLSSELILCIFEYLSVADRYKSFFNCDTRLSQLVKRWTWYSRKGLDADILRFSILHSWYKLSLRDGGPEFYIYPRQGQEPYNSMSIDSNSPDLHWWFIWYVDKVTFTDERVAEIIRRHSFRLTPFFYHRVIGVQSNSDSNEKKPMCCRFYGGHLITRYRDREIFKSWIMTNYPEHADRILNENSAGKSCTPVFEAEWLRLTGIIRNAANTVWEELRQLEDVNLLEIRSTC